MVFFSLMYICISIVLLNLKIITMTPELKSLIEASVVNGQVDANARKIILAKANQQGINEDECDLFIASVIRAHEGQQKAITAEVNYRAYSLIVFGLIDFIYGLSIANQRYAQEVALICILTGLACMFFGAHLLGKNVKGILKGLGWLILIWAVIEIPIGKIFGSKNHRGGVVVGIEGVLIYFLIIVFRKKIFGKKFIDWCSRLGSARVLFDFIDTIRKKVLPGDRIEKFLES